MGIGGLNLRSPTGSVHNPKIRRHLAFMVRGRETDWEEGTGEVQVQLLSMVIFLLLYRGVKSSDSILKTFR